MYHYAYKSIHKMIGFQDELNNMINKQIFRFLSEISTSYTIPYEDLVKIWETGQKNEKKISENKVKNEKKQVKKLVENKVKNGDVEKNKKATGCIYVFKRGKNKGKMCGCKCVKGSQYCSKHKKYEYKEQKIKKEIVPKVVQKQTIIRMNKKINKFWHPETRLVFKSKSKRVVIGICSKDNEILNLSDKDKEVCKLHSFAFEDIPEEQKIKNEVEEAILDTNLQAKDIENILNELQINEDINSDFDSEDEILDEED